VGHCATVVLWSPSNRGFYLSGVDQSSSKLRTSATCPVTLAVTSTFPLSTPPLWNGMSPLAHLPNYPWTSRRSSPKTAFHASLPPIGMPSGLRETVPETQTDHRKYKNGGVGVLTHLAVLQGTSYSCELEVYCDGYLFKSVPRLLAHTPHVRLMTLLGCLTPTTSLCYMSAGQVTTTWKNTNSQATTRSLQRSRSLWM
jgi:hypothetical protein